MFDLKLFLGFAPDLIFQQEQKRADPYLLTMFVGKEEYLQKITLQEKLYLGKEIGSFPTIDQLEDLEKHLLSLLHKIAPHYCFANNRPVLLTYSRS